MTQFSVTLEDDEEVEIEWNFRNGKVNGKTVRSIYYRDTMFLENERVCLGDPKIMQEEEFVHLLFKDCLSSVTIFFDGIFLCNAPHIADFNQKCWQYMRAKKIGLLQADTVMTNDTRGPVKFFIDSGRFDKVLFKNMEAFIMFNAVMPASLLSKENLVESAEEQKEVPRCFQEFCRKDKELRITAVDGLIYVTSINSTKYERTAVDFKVDQGIPDTFALEETSPEVRDVIVKYFKEFGFMTGVFDIIRDPEGRLWFLECNQIGQWLFHSRFTGARIERSYANYLIDGKWKEY